MKIHISKKQIRLIRHYSATMKTDEIATLLSLPPDVVTRYVPSISKLSTSKPLKSPVEIRSLLFRHADIALFGLFFLTGLLYLNILGNKFVSDDIQAIQNNPLAGNVLYQLLNATLSGVLNALLYLAFGANPLVYHIHSIFWHIAAVIAGYFLVKLVTERHDVALISAVLFATHPIHTEAVSWISGIPYVLYTFFGFASFIIYILLDKGLLKPWWKFILAGLMYVVYYSSEKGVILLPLFFLYSLLYSSFKRWFYILWPSLFTTGFYLFKLFFRFGSRVSDVNPSYQDGTTFYNPLLQIPVAVSTYLKLLVWPSGLTLYHEDFRISQLEFSIHLLVFILFSLLGFFLWFKGKKHLFFFILFFAVSLLPMLLPVKISWIVAERYIYFGSLGIFVIFTYFLMNLTRIHNYLFYTTLFVVIIALCGLTFWRNTEWYDQDSLWPATVRASPTSSRAWNNMGDYYGRHNDLDKAIQAFSIATQLDQRYPEALHNLGNAYSSKGDATRAATLYVRALSLNPALAESTVNLVGIYLKQHRFNEAGQVLEKAERINPKSALIKNAWGIYFYSINDYERAKLLFTSALQLDPTFTLARDNLEKISSSPGIKRSIK